jgi:rhamnosyltransferase subunit B
MRVILASVGKDGDIFPYVGLGAALRSRGHEVTLTASAHYESLASAHDLVFRALVSAEENHELFGNPDFWNPLNRHHGKSDCGGRPAIDLSDLFRPNR